MAVTPAVFLSGETKSGKKVTLRPLSKDHIPSLHKWINDPTNRQNLAIMFPLSENQENDWFEKLTTQTGLPTDIVLAVYFEEVFVGVIGLHNINYIHRYATTGLNIGEKKYRHQGIGSTAKKILVDYAFGELNFNSLSTEVHQYNEPSQKLQKSCGWIETGRYPKRLFKNGQWSDLIIYSILREEWEKQKA